MSPILDQITIAIANVQVPLAGHISSFAYWYEGLAGFLSLNLASPPVVPKGTALSLAIGWTNDGNVSLQGHIDLVITKPDGTKVTPSAYEGQDSIATPKNGKGVAFNITLDQVGVYSGLVTLSGA